MANQNKIFKIRNCPLCNGDSYNLNYELCERLAYKHLPDDIVFKVVRCSGCGLLFVNPRLRKSILDELYAKDLYDSWGDNKTYIPKVGLRYDIYHHNLEERLVAYDHFLDKLSVHVNYGKVFEVGTGFGYLLSKFQERGYHVSGVELSKATSKFSKEKFGFENVCCGDFLDLEVKESFYDVVILWHVFEHVYHPNQTIKKSIKMLKPGGLIMITCPFHDSYTPDRINPVEHLYYFKQDDVVKFLSKHIEGDVWVENPYVFARKA